MGSKASGLKTHYLQCHSGYFFSGFLVGSGLPIEGPCALLLKGDLCASGPPKQYGMTIILLDISAIERVLI